MSDRTIGGLTPRGLTPRAGEQDLSRLQRRNRPDEPAPPAAPDPAAAAADVPSPAAPAAPAAPVRRHAPVATPPPVQAEAEKIKATVYLDPAVRERARAAYRATGHLEGERSWSEFVETAIAREVERRESAHNHGQPYARDNSRLAPGRPLD